MQPMQLRGSVQQMQQRFADGLLDISQAGSNLALFSGDAALAEDRLALYRGNLNAIWSQALANAFPVIRQLVGEEFFEQIAREYGHLYPSQHGDLNHFGAHFADFLAHAESVADYPYFTDVARLEWLAHRAYYAEDARVIGLADLAAAAVHGVEQLRLLLHPACYLYQSAWAAADVWHAHQPGSELSYPEQLQRDTYAVVSRPEWQARVMMTGKAAHSVLQALMKGSLLGEALELALQEDAQFDIAHELGLWFEAGIFSQAVAVAPVQDTQ
ncbi:putative DNA-binding domain-containing protein [Undibacterium sp.]|uniref:HvfC/BufC family peptide modification chaperone n=1 Tax=Undibacterium sp. TaxID=1914977 RepID=UPI00374CEC4E